MQSSTGFPEGEIDAGAPLHALWHWMFGAAEHVLLGLLLGWMATGAMRALRLRWTWGPAALGLILLAAVPLEPVSWSLMLASGIATGRARRREREEMLRGAAPAAAARAMRGPIDLALLSLRAAARRWRCQGGLWFAGDSLLVGYDGAARPVEVALQGSSGGSHTLVVGAAGSGKTVTQTWLAVRAIEAGMPAIVVDPKDDPDLAGRVREAAAAAGRRFFEWSPDGPSVYNPYAAGSDSEIADKALAGERFTEPHYLRQAQRFLGWEVRTLRAAGVECSLSTLAQHLDPGRLETVLRRLPEADAAAGCAYLDALSARQRSDLTGVRDRLAIVAESDVGRWLDPCTHEGASFDLLQALRARAVVLFRLQSDRRPLIMQMLGGAIVLDLLAAAGALQRSPVASIAVIDEFAALAAPHIGGLFGRARGAGISLVLATQEISDLQLPGRENLLRQVTGNLTTTISHRQVNPESAEWVSKLSGLRPAWGATFASDGRWTYRPLQERRIAPEQVTALRAGQAAVIAHDGARRSARIARMLSVAATR